MGCQDSGVKLLPGRKTTEAELALWPTQQRPVAEHFPTVSFEACWGLFSLPEFEGLACAHCTTARVRFDLTGSLLEVTLSADEACPESYPCLPDMA